MTEEELEVWTNNRDEQREKLLSTFCNREGKPTHRDWCIRTGITQTDS